ncbi:LytR/AlgR family response regulator transcription factor [Pedobacter africanus]|uniref:Two component transcriptional regulator, LytTR family n=1 Tax=Pedobacter africanus TaxID=151894 RepID=A0A1W1Z989_9SPHI|nr:LytTR family DNA-binding domain-containing protein [Pedobacter africanus]SMC44518.1 two component transcriptional regulator, LytTR family [Pedobacter africanus]
MEILIIEDEENAASQLSGMLLEYYPAVSFAPVIDNITDAKAYLSSKPDIDLIFLDINLSDGISFEIFKDVKIDIPVIFTTAYDQYAVQAFELNSIDYLLKPIRKEKLISALEKFSRLSNRQPNLANAMAIEKIAALLQSKMSYKQNFLIPFNNRLVPLNVNDISWFELCNGLVKAVTSNHTTHILEEKSLDELAELLDPKMFYRANRQYLISRKAIKDVHYYFNGRLQVNIVPEPEEKVVVSKVKAVQFKNWLKI